VVALSLDVLSNTTVSPGQPVRGPAVKFAAGGVIMVTVCVTVEDPQAFVAVSTTV
jgi:hypothetical protein